MLGQASDQRVHRAMCVRRLCGAPQRELARHGVEVSHGTTGLHWSWVHAWVDDLLFDFDIGAIPHRIELGLIARIPIKDVVVALALEVVTNDAAVGVHGFANIDDWIEEVVFNIDQLERIASGVLILGNDEGNFLVLEANLVGGEHGLDIVRQRWHPRQAMFGEVCAGDDGDNLGVSFGC